MAVRTSDRLKNPPRGMHPEFGRIAAAVMVKAGRLEEAQRFADASADPSAHALVASAYVGEQKYQQAKDAYLKALQLGDVAQARQGVTALLIYMAARESAHEEWDQAAGYLKEAIRADSDNPALRRYHEAVLTAALMRGVSADKMEEAIPHLEKLQEEQPSRADVAHQLAMIYHHRAIGLEETSESAQRDQCWERALANWAVVIESDEYWPRWDESREYIYEKPIDDAEVEKLRHQTIGRIIREIHDQYIRLYSDSNRKSHLERHKNLRATWGLELAMARALHETVKLLQSKGKMTGWVIPSGPLMWKRLGIVDKVADTARAALKLSSSFSPAQEVLNGTTPVGIAKIMIEEGQLMEAIALLEEYLAKSSRDPAARGFIASAYMKCAQTVVNSNLEEAIGYWVKAKSFGAPAAEVENEISGVVFKEAKKREDRGGLHDAESVLKLGLKHAPTSKPLRDKLAQISNQRAVNLMNGLKQNSTPSQVLATLQKAQTILQEADRLAGPNHPVLQKSLKDLGQIRAQMVHAEAIALNNKAMEMVNSLQYEFPRVQYMSYWDRQNLCTKIREAEGLLARAYELSVYDSTVRQNLDQVRALAAAICR
ncbi:MAG: tetratricopeptide repeat protein [Chloroflexota bacterium]